MGLTATVATFKSSVQEPSNVTAGAKPDVDTVGRERLGPSSRGGFPRRSRTQEVGECPIELVIKKQEDAREPFPPPGFARTCSKRVSALLPCPGQPRPPVRPFWDASECIRADVAEEPQAAAPKELRRREAMSLDWGARMGMRWANARREAIQVFADGSGLGR